MRMRHSLAVLVVDLGNVLLWMRRHQGHLSVEEMEYSCKDRPRTTRWTNMLTYVWDWGKVH